VHLERLYTNPAQNALLKSRMQSPSPSTSPAPAKGLNLLDSTMLIMGSMIGSGIFIVSAGISRSVLTPGMLILVWVVTGIITVFGALSYGELAAMMPRAGGQYVYLKAAFGNLTAFLYGWTLFAVIQTGTIAAVGVAFAKYTGVFIPWISGQNILLQVGGVGLSSEQLLGIVAIIVITMMNFRAVKSGAAVQNILTFAKIGALVVMIGLGLWAGLSGTGSSANFSIPTTWPENFSWALVPIFFAAMVGSLFSSDAWNNVTFTAGEVTNPQRNLPLSLAIGTLSVSIIYVLVNITYLYVLPITDIANASNDRVATVVMQKVLGDAGVYFIAAMIVVSTLGCLNGVILTAARVYYAMALDGLFLKPAAKLNKNQVPANSLVMQCVWSVVLAFTGTYGDLLNYVMFAVVLFYIITIIGLFVLRRKQPDAPRPYRVWGYPWVPAAYILLAGTFCITVLFEYPKYTGFGLLLILAGVPVYYLFARNAKT